MTILGVFGLYMISLAYQLSPTAHSPLAAALLYSGTLLPVPSSCVVLIYPVPVLALLSDSIHQAGDMQLYDAPAATISTALARSRTG